MANTTVPTNIRIRATFAPRQVAPDPPGAKRRAQLLETPSCRMRERAAEFARILVGLVPDHEYHGLVIRTLRDLVVVGEERLIAVLETRDDCKGHTFSVSPAPHDPETEVPKEPVSAQAHSEPESSARNPESNRYSKGDDHKPWVDSQKKPKKPKHKNQ